MALTICNCVTETFVYHSGNICYKPYLLATNNRKKGQEDLEIVAHNADESKNICVNSGKNDRTLRSPDFQREKPCSKKPIRELKLLKVTLIVFLNELQIA